MACALTLLFPQHLLNFVDKVPIRFLVFLASISFLAFSAMLAVTHFYPKPAIVNMQRAQRAVTMLTALLVSGIFIPIPNLRINFEDDRWVFVESGVREIGESALVNFFWIGLLFIFAFSVLNVIAEKLNGP